MLSYLGYGTRYYHDFKHMLMRRNQWEFLAVLDGHVGMVVPDGPGILHRHHLWLARPGHYHGWTSPPGARSEVAVFHFPYLPDALSRLIPPARDVIELSLGSEQVDRIHSLRDEALRYWQKPRIGCMICYEHILMELSLMILESLTHTDSPDTLTDLRARRVARAIEWFGDHLKQNPDVEQAAHAVGVSPAQLRRDFRYWMKSSPLKVFHDIRFVRAIELIGEQNQSLETIAAQCGFNSASDFSRAFRRRFGASPRQWHARHKIRNIGPPDPRGQQAKNPP